MTSLKQILISFNLNVKTKQAHVHMIRNHAHTRARTHTGKNIHVFLTWYYLGLFHLYFIRTSTQRRKSIEKGIGKLNLLHDWVWRKWNSFITLLWSNFIGCIESLVSTGIRLSITLETSVASVIRSEKHLKLSFRWKNQWWFISTAEFAPKRRNSTKLGDEIIIHSHPVSFAVFTISLNVKCCKMKFYLVAIGSLQSPITRTSRGVLERVVRRRQSTRWIVGQIKLNDSVSWSAYT